MSDTTPTPTPSQDDERLTLTAAIKTVLQRTDLTETGDSPGIILHEWCLTQPAPSGEDKVGLVDYINKSDVDQLRVFHDKLVSAAVSKDKFLAQFAGATLGADGTIKEEDTPQSVRDSEAKPEGPMPEPDKTPAKTQPKPAAKTPAKTQPKPAASSDLEAAVTMLAEAILANMPTAPQSSGDTSALEARISALENRCDAQKKVILANKAEIASLKKPGEDLGL